MGLPTERIDDPDPAEDFDMRGIRFASAVILGIFVVGVIVFVSLLFWS